jgi:hypothetical protein
MPFETPYPGLLEGEITNVIVHEHDFTAPTPAVPPTTIIQAGEPWAVSIWWEMNGPDPLLWHLVSGHWRVSLRLESIGPGPEFNLSDLADSNCQDQFLPSPSGTYFCHFDVPGSVLDDSVVPDEGLAMKLVVLITYRDPLDHQGPIAAYEEGPILQFYREEHD